MSTVEGFIGLLALLRLIVKVAHVHRLTDDLKGAYTPSPKNGMKSHAS